MSAQPDIIYTKVDEAPQLASGSFLPIIQAFTQVAGINVGTKDISLAGRIIAQFPERLKPEQQQPDDLALLGEVVLDPDANVIKLPNISASNPQIKAAIEELQSQGYDLPDCPEDPQNDEEKAIERAKKTLAFYVSVGQIYREFLAKNGFQKETEIIFDEYQRSGLKSNYDLVPESMLEQLCVYGTPEQSLKKLKKFHEAGVNLPIIQFNPIGDVDTSFNLLMSTFSQFENE